MRVCQLDRELAFEKKYLQSLVHKPPKIQSYEYISLNNPLPVIQEEDEESNFYNSPNFRFLSHVHRSRRLSLQREVCIGYLEDIYESDDIALHRDDPLQRSNTENLDLETRNELFTIDTNQTPETHYEKLGVYQGPKPPADFFYLHVKPSQNEVPVNPEDDFSDRVSSKRRKKNYTSVEYHMPSTPSLGTVVQYEVDRSRAKIASLEQNLDYLRSFLSSQYSMEQVNSILKELKANATRYPYSKLKADIENIHIANQRLPSDAMTLTNTVLYLDKFDSSKAIDKDFDADSSESSSRNSRPVHHGMGFRPYIRRSRSFLSTKEISDNYSVDKARKTRAAITYSRKKLKYRKLEVAVYCVFLIAVMISIILNLIIFRIIYSSLDSFKDLFMAINLAKAPGEVYRYNIMSQVRSKYDFNQSKYFESRFMTNAKMTLAYQSMQARFSFFFHLEPENRIEWNQDPKYNYNLRIIRTSMSHYTIAANIYKTLTELFIMTQSKVDIQSEAAAQKLRRVGYVALSLLLSLLQYVETDLMTLENNFRLVLLYLEATLACSVILSLMISKIFLLQLS